MPIDESLQAQIETYVSHLGGLIRRGCQLRDALSTAPSDMSAISATRAWQEDCGVTINQLSGGSKAHWLARSFSQAFLMRSASGHAVEGAAPAEIVKRLLDVLEQAVATLSAMDGGPGISVSSSASREAPPPHRFDFVHNPELRPVVEQSYIDSWRALERGDYDVALRTSCGILEAIVTDALAHKGLTALAASGAPAAKVAEGKAGEEELGEGKATERTIADWSFDMRLSVAERVGLIRGGCARLPAVARTYRRHTGAGSESGLQATVSERDARVAGQVLHVVMRDLDPGR